jgi:hypothetical protein
MLYIVEIQRLAFSRGHIRASLIVLISAYALFAWAGRDHRLRRHLRACAAWAVTGKPFLYSLRNLSLTADYGRYRRAGPPQFHT